MFALRPALILALFILCLGRPLGAEPRFALVVGNSDYQHVTTLPNPSRDAETIAKTLEALGFEVIELIDVDRTGLTRGIVQFGRKLREAGSLSLIHI